MATIKSFTAIQPDPFFAGQLVFPGEEQVFYFGTGQELPLLPLKSLLETPARTRPETEAHQQQAYQAIKENLDKLLAAGRLIEDEKPGVYIYEIVHKTYRQTGIWALTPVKDYLDGKIRLHEFTLADSERRISNYRKNTGLEGSPVLVTYMPDVTINRIIAETCAKNKKTTIGSKQRMHRIWKIEDQHTLDRLTEAFEKIDTVYMADGHHRLAAAAKLARETGRCESFSALYMAADQLRIREYYRVVFPGTPIDPQRLIAHLKTRFTISPDLRNEPVKPDHGPCIGMYLSGQWYRLVAQKADTPDVILLQEKILAPLFGITHPRTDTRLKCTGGETAMEDTLKELCADPAAIAFTLCPLTVEQLLAAAGAGQMLPPKSTWIDPKVPYGLLLVRHETTLTKAN
jgi:uncharacterized protein (DUF1015 family)